MRLGEYRNLRVLLYTPSAKIPAANIFSPHKSRFIVAIPPQQYKNRKPCAACGFGILLLLSHKSVAVMMAHEAERHLSGSPAAAKEMQGDQSRRIGDHADAAFQGGCI